MNRRPAAKLAAVAAATLLLAQPALSDAQPAAKVAPGDSAPSERPVAISPLATPPVERLHAKLLEVMRAADELGYQGRYDSLSPVVTETFDLPFMASKSVGRHWKKLPQADQDRLLDVFVELITANYAGQFNAWSGEGFETLGEEARIHDTRLVLTQLTRPHEDAVQLNYRLREIDGAWKIIDIYLNGTVSELALRRSEYSSVLKREGFEKLIQNLREKVESLSRG